MCSNRSLNPNKIIITSNFGMQTIDQEQQSFPLEKQHSQDQSPSQLNPNGPSGKFGLQKYFFIILIILIILVLIILFSQWYFTSKKLIQMRQKWKKQRTTHQMIDLEFKQDIAKYYDVKEDDVEQENVEDYLTFNQTEAYIPFKYFINGINQYYAKNKLSPILSINSNLAIQNSNERISATKVQLADVDQIDSKFKWMHFEDPGSLLYNDGFHSKFEGIVKNVENGFTLVWNNKDDFLIQWVYSLKREDFEETFAKLGFYFHEIQSLNLRASEKKFILIFKSQKTVKKTLEFSGIKTPNFLSINTIFRMEDNLPFLREWIGYHIHLGVDKFFLYYNYGSETDVSRSTANKTKYGFDFSCFGYDQARVIKQFDEIWEEFYDHIVFVVWQPLNQDGKIFDAQPESFKHYKYYFEDVTTFAALTDMDEYIFSPENIHLEDFLREHNQKEDYTHFKILQMRFGNRYCYDQSLVTQIYDYHEANTTAWAPKSIVLMKYFKPGFNVHHHKVRKGKTMHVEPEVLRFNHYNVVEFSLLYGFKRDFVASPISLKKDDSMKRYQEAMKKICGLDRCSQHFILQCRKGESFSCLEFGKVYTLTQQQQDEQLK